jgi:broad specificity phosphatase PhoE
LYRTVTPQPGRARHQLGECAELTIVRHGQSVANAAVLAEAAGHPGAEVFGPDADVRLSDLGRRQAIAVGYWWAALPAGRLPDVVLSSPYLRARQTLDLAAATASGRGARVSAARVDDRLRDRGMGELEMMSRRQVAERFPEEARRRQATAEFVYRPPGGESFGDIADRLASLLVDVRRDHDGCRVLLVAHDAVVLMLRYLLERLSWDGVRAIAAEGMAGNASITRWVNVDGRLVLSEYNSTGHLHEHPGAGS